MESANETRNKTHKRPMGQKQSWCADLEGTIYFVSCRAKDFPIKIGWTSDMKGRIQSLQSGLPHPLVVLLELPGTPSRERDLHISFNEHKLNGEWFARHPEIMDFIKIHKTDGWL